MTIDAEIFWAAAVVIALSYLLGCLNMAYYYVRLKQAKDIRQSGSGNAGARNVGRLLGRGAFVLVLFADGAKAVTACSIGQLVSMPCAGLCALAVVAGHVWPAQLQWRGGKGVACALGALAVLMPAVLGGLAVAYVVFRIAGLSNARAGVMAFAGMSMSAVWVYAMPQIATLWVLTAILAWSHRNDIERGK